MRIGCVGAKLPWATHIKPWLESGTRKLTELSHTNHDRTNQTTQSNLQPEHYTHSFNVIFGKAFANTPSLGKRIQLCSHA